MQDPNSTVLKRSISLWISAFLLTTLYAVGAWLASPALLHVAFIATGVYALYGIGFGIWAGRKLSKAC
jgi:presenilin-like A22 family membrane protease